MDMPPSDCEGDSPTPKPAWLSREGGSAEGGVKGTTRLYGALMENTGLEDVSGRARREHAHNTHTRAHTHGHTGTGDSTALASCH